MQIASIGTSACLDQHYHLLSENLFWDPQRGPDPNVHDNMIKSTKNPHNKDRLLTPYLTS